MLSVQLGLRGNNYLRVGRKIANFQLFFSVQGTGGSPTGPDPENRVGDQDTGSPGRPVSPGLQVPREPRYCRAKTRPPWWPSRGVFPLKCPSIAPNQQRWIILHIDSLGPLEDNQWGGCRLDPTKSRRDFSSVFLHSEFLGRCEPLCRHSIDCCFVSKSWWYKQVSSMVTNHDRKSFGSRRKNSKFAQTPGNVDVFDPHSGILGPTSRRASACPNLHEWWIQPTHMRCPVAQLLI